MARLFFILFLVFALSQNVLAQMYNFRQFSLEQGLSQSQVFDICQDVKGRIWLATYGGGVTVYDGHNTQYFSLEEGLPSYSILSLFADSKGNIWIGTSLGVVFFDGNKIINIDTKKEINVPVWRIKESKDGTIWLACNNGLWKYKDGQLNISELSNKQVYSLYIDSKDNIWYTTISEGLVKYDGNRKYDDIVDKDLYITEILEDKQENIWFGTSSGLLKKTKPGERFYTINDGLSNDYITSLYQDDKNRIWVGTDAGGLNVIDNNKIITISEEQGIGFSRVNKIFEDNNKDIWVATDGAGAALFNGFTFKSLKFSNLNANNFIMSVFVDGDTKWFGTDGDGLIKYNNDGDYTLFDDSKGLIDNSINEMIKDRNGKYWIATAGGVSTWDGKRFVNYDKNNGLSDDFIMSLLEDYSGNIWIGSHNAGLSWFHNNKLEPFTDTVRLHLNTIWDIFQASDSTLYFATDEGFVKYDYKSFKRYTAADGLIDNAVGTIIEDKNGILWIGTDNGISRFDGKKFKNYDSDNGISSNIIYVIEFDSEENLIVGTEKGIDKISFTRNGNIVSVRHFGRDEGFFGIECNANAIDKDKDGVFWIGTIDGVTIYDPNEEYVCDKEPNTHITNIKLFYEKTNWDLYADSLTKWYNLPIDLELNYKQNNLTFEFVGINFNIPEKVKYMYKLTGLDYNWVPVTENNYARYTNIPTGEYTFEVKACNHDGIWNKESTKFSFYIAPPFWQRWWFYILVSILAGIIIYSYIKFRIRKLEKSKKQLAKLVKERTFEVLRQKEEIVQKSINLQQAYKDITDSVRYAKRIQEAMLPSIDYLHSIIPNSFIYYKPKDIVSGDFFWFYRKDDLFVIAAVDCTGHGVPGAFMSMIGNNLLTQIVSEEGIIEPNKILHELDSRLISAIHHSSEFSNDGMDISLCTINLKTNNLIFSGALRPLYLIRNKELIAYKGNKFSIGGHEEANKRFTNSEIQLEQNDVVYLFSDGYPDQFGGKDEKKFLLKRFKKMLINVSQLPISEQEKIIIRTFKDWKGDFEQIDDVLVIGIKI